MNALIFGAGRRGLRLARHLIEEGRSVTFLDSSPGRSALAQSKLDCMAITGSATDLDKLIEAGCEGADIVVAVTDSDEVNLVSCGIVKSNFPKVHTIATIRSITYLGSNEKGHTILGIDNIVNPEQEAGQRLYDIITSGLFCDIAYFPGAHYIVTTKTLTKGDLYLDKNLIELKKMLPGRYLVAGVKHRGKVSTATGNTTLREGDEIAIICDDDERDDIYNRLGIPYSDFRLRRIIILGGTRIARYLLALLPEKMHRDITLVEKDSSICAEFSDMFPSILILNGAITDENFWDTENIADSDLFISLTENDELNIIVASYAKRIGVRRSIALIKTNNNYIQLADAMDIDAAISITDATVDTITKYLRGAGIQSLHSIFDGDLEVYEYVVSSDFRYIGKKLMDVNLKGKAIIAGVKSPDGNNFIPDGSYAFAAGDTLLVASTHQNFDFVQELFSLNRAEKV